MFSGPEANLTAELLNQGKAVYFSLVKVHPSPPVLLPGCCLFEARHSNIPSHCKALNTNPPLLYTFTDLSIHYASCFTPVVINKNYCSYSSSVIMAIILALLMVLFS